MIIIPFFSVQEVREGIQGFTKEDLINSPQSFAIYRNDIPFLVPRYLFFHDWECKKCHATVAFFIAICNGSAWKLKPVVFIDHRLKGLLTKDHIVPKAKHKCLQRKLDKDFQPLCVRCNGIKGYSNNESFMKRPLDGEFTKFVHRHETKTKKRVIIGLGDLC